MTRQALASCAVNSLAREDYELRPCENVGAMLNGNGATARVYCPKCRMFAEVDGGGKIYVSRKPLHQNMRRVPALREF
jgi:hypothetical protein